MNPDGSFSFSILNLNEQIFCSDEHLCHHHVKVKLVVGRLSSLGCSRPYCFLAPGFAVLKERHIQFVNVIGAYTF